MEYNSRYLAFILALLIFTLINLFILDIKVLFPAAGLRISQVAMQISPTPTLTASNTFNENVCPNACLSLINQVQTASTPGQIGAPQTTVQTVTAATVKEYFIPLGSGNTNKSDWENMVATETVFNPSSYGRIKEAYFIASLRNPTKNGQVETVLYNVTDKHEVWGSHVIMKNIESQTITSDKIVLPTGNKLYRVMLKSTMNYLAYLDNAKIRIITE